MDGTPQGSPRASLRRKVAAGPGPHSSGRTVQILQGSWVRNESAGYQLFRVKFDHLVIYSYTWLELAVKNGDLTMKKWGRC